MAREVTRGPRPRGGAAVGCWSSRLAVSSAPLTRSAGQKWGVMRHQGAVLSRLRASSGQKRGVMRYQGAVLSRLRASSGQKWGVMRHQGAVLSRLAGCASVTQLTLSGTPGTLGVRSEAAPSAGHPLKTRTDLRFRLPFSLLPVASDPPRSGARAPHRSDQ